MPSIAYRQTLPASKKRQANSILLPSRWTILLYPPRKLQWALLVAKSVSFIDPSEHPNQSAVSFHPSEQSIQPVILTQVSKQISQLYRSKWASKSVSYIDPSKQQNQWVVSIQEQSNQSVILTQVAKSVNFIYPSEQANHSVVSTQVSSQISQLFWLK